MSEVTTSGTFSLGDVILATEPTAGAHETSPSGIMPEVPSSQLLPIVVGTPGDVLKQFFDEEYADTQFSQEDAVRVAKSIHSLRRGGSAGQRLICAGDNCEFREACELWKTKLTPTVTTRDPTTGHETVVYGKTAAPEGKPCPLEEVVVQDARMRYALEFQDIMTEGDEPKVVEGYINDLCQIEMMVWRCNMIMAFDYANPLIQSPGAVTSDGKIVWKPEANPILEIQERLQQRKTRILNDLVKTPREKYKKQHAIGDVGEDSLGRRLAAKKAKMKEITGETLPDEMEVPKHVKDTSK